MFIRDGCFQKKRYPELARAGSCLCQAEAQSTRADVSQKSIPQAIGLPPLTHHGCKSLGCFQSYCYGAVLAPDVIVRKKYYRLQFALELAACSNHWLHLVKMQGNFCSPKEQIAKLAASLPWPGPLGKEVGVDKCLYFGRQTCSSGQELSSEEMFFVTLICFSHF